MAILGSTIIKGRLKVNGTINGYTLNAAAGYGTDSTISANATGIPTSQAIVNYVTSAIETWKTNNGKTASNISVSDVGVITVEAGYYESDTTKTLTSGSATPSVSSYSAPSVNYTYSVTGMSTSQTATNYYFTYGGTKTNGSVKGKVTRTKGWITAGSTESDETVIVPSLSGGGTIYIPAAVFSYVTSSDGYEFISCTTAGYCPTGVISPSNTGSMDIVNYSLGYGMKLYNSSNSSYSGGDILVLTSEPDVKSYAAKLSFTVSTLNPGYVRSGSDLNTSPIYIPTASVTAGVNSSTAAVVTPGLSSSGVVFLNSGTSDFSVTPSATATAAKFTPKATTALNNSAYTSAAGLVTVGTVTGSEVTKTTTVNSGTTKYIQAAVLANAQNSYTAPAVTTSVTGMSTSSIATNYKISTTNSTAGSITVRASASTEGYIKNQTKDFTKSLSATLPNDIYIKAGTTVLNEPTIGSTTTTISGGDNATLSDTNTSGIIISSSTSGTVSASATVYEGYQLNNTLSSSGTISAFGSKYLTAITVPKDKTFSVTMTADTAQDTTSNLTITNAAYRAIAINGGDADKGVLINGANGKTVTVDTVQVTDANGDLTTTSRSAGSTTITSDYLTTTNTGYTVTAYGTVSTGTGWISSGSTNSTTATRYVKAGTAGAVTGGALTHGATSFSAGSDYLTTTNTGYTITATNTASVSAASYSITTAGWITSAGAGTTASGNDVKTVTRYIKAGAAHDGYVTTAGWITKDTSVYTLTYDSTNQRVDFVFNDA